MVREADYYTAHEAARGLGISPARMRQMLRAGELEGERGPSLVEGAPGPWLVPASAARANLEDRKAAVSSETVAMPREEVFPPDAPIRRGESGHADGDLGASLRGSWSPAGQGRGDPVGVGSAGGSPGGRRGRTARPARDREPRESAGRKAAGRAQQDEIRPTDGVTRPLAEAVRRLSASAQGDGDALAEADDAALGEALGAALGDTLGEGVGDAVGPVVWGLVGSGVAAGVFWGFCLAESVGAS
jgi:hypothetical protein